MKVAHVITGLFTGGAEIMLYKLLSLLDRKEFETEVVSLANVGPIGEEIRALGIQVRSLGMRPEMPNPLGVGRLATWLRRSQVDVLQTWMYHADLVGGFAAKLSGKIPVIWNVRHWSPGSESAKCTTWLTAEMCARFSRALPARIVCCSHAAQESHVRFGYAADRMVVIPNGFDLDHFKPDPEARLSVRRELDVLEDTPLIGLVARFRPEKDHQTFIRAASIVRAFFPEAHFLLCGAGIVWQNPALRDWIVRAGIQDRCHLLGERTDISRIHCALDIACSSSHGEGFSNTVGEAMACGVPCAVTDVGDSSMIVGDSGKVVPPQNAAALAAAWRKLLEIGPERRRSLGLAARSRIERHFSLPSVVARYQRLYEEVAFQARRGERAADWELSHRVDCGKS